MKELLWMVPLALLIMALLIRRLKADAEKRYTRAIVKKRLKNLNMYFSPESRRTIKADGGCA